VITSTAFAGKRYAVLGLARSGLAAVEALLASGARITAWDTREEPRRLVADRVEVADPASIDLTGFDGVVVSPGVPLISHPVAENAARHGVPVIGDIELFALARATLPPHRVVGITGTNGKSTPTALVHHLLGAAGIPARMGGNIGLPVLSQRPLSPNANGAGVYVLELSSYQLDLTRSLDCDVAALLNVSPDHLDRYPDFSAYVASKARMFAMQSAAHRAVFAPADPNVRALAEREMLRRGGDSVHLAYVERFAALQPDWPSLQGPHNLENVAVAVAIVEALGVAREAWEPALVTYRGLPHRMERVTEAGGVLFVNDSKATNPASAAPALAAFPPAPHPRIHWILGGLPKGDGLDECARWFGNVAAAYTIGEAGPRFAEILEPHMHVERCELLCEAVQRARTAARSGDVVLFSPACASFDQFRDYEARGDAFRAIVRCLTEPEQVRAAGL
jgi:UDP-N-acetylmuramoylalanine--D-glutamate ligase